MSVVTVEQPVDLGRIWRSVRTPSIFVLLGIGLVTVLALISSVSNSRSLDPGNTGPTGAHALADLLKDRGVSVGTVDDIGQLTSSTDTTVLLSDPGAVSYRALRAVARSQATMLLIDPTAAALRAAGITASIDARVMAPSVLPVCSLTTAVTAGSVSLDGDLYAATGPVDGCYRAGADAALLEATRPGGGVTIAFGSTSTFTNADLAKEGNAALALGLIRTPRLQWVPAGLNDGRAPAAQRGLLNLLPPRVLWATLQAFIAVVVLGLWRARRLGRPVVEPLPVVVRAAETTEGRARLLQAGRARDTAARSLRAATLSRISRALRTADDDPTATVQLVAERSLRSGPEIQALLYGDDPSDDEALVHLAQELPRLESDVLAQPGLSPAAPHSDLAAPHSDRGQEGHTVLRGQQ